MLSVHFEMSQLYDIDRRINTSPKDYAYWIPLSTTRKA